MKESIKIGAADGFALSVSCFIPKHFNNKVVLINSATGVRQEYYHDFATWLSEQGFRVYTYDYRGIGRSKPQTLKGFQTTMHEWGTLDYHSVLKYLFSAFPDSHFTVIGHSVGGQIVGMSPLSENLDSLITVAAQTPYWRNYPQKIKLIAFWYLMIPSMTKLFGYFPAAALRLFQDLPSGVARQWARWAKSDRYLFDELPYMKDRFAGLHQPALMISFSDDKLAPIRAVLQLMSYFKNVKWSHLHIKPEDIAQQEIGHFSFFKKRNAAAFWGETIRWIESQTVSIKESKAA